MHAFEKLPRSDVLQPGMELHCTQGIIFSTEARARPPGSRLADRAVFDASVAASMRVQCVIWSILLVHRQHACTLCLLALEKAASDDPNGDLLKQMLRADVHLEFIEAGAAGPKSCSAGGCIAYDQDMGLTGAGAEAE
jgi:hypothetical protein